MATAYIPKKGDAQKNRDRYNAATKNSQSIADYISSGGQTTSNSNKTSGTVTTMRGTGSGTTSKSYADTLKENITNTVKNPTAGAYSSLGNNSLMKDMVTAYNYSTGGTKTPTVVTETVEEVYNPYDELDSMIQAYKEQQEELIREQNRRAVEQGTNRLNAQKESINQSADENARQAYIQYMQSQKALPQQLASQGVRGGATETANLGLQTAYQNNVNTINQNKVNRLQEIDNAIVDLQNTGDLTMVEQVLANNQTALDAYMNTFDKSVGYNQWAQQFNANREDTLADQAYRDKTYEAQQAQAYLDAINEQNKLLSDEKKEERDNILKLYTGGYMSRDEAAARLGYDPAILYDTMGYLAQENALALKDKQTDINNTQSQISNRNSVSNGGTKTNQTYTQVLNAIQEMNTTAGEDYNENLASARYLLNSDLNMNNVISIMKQTNVRPEAFVKQMVDEGLPEQDVVDFIEAYTPKQDYRNALYQYAYK